MDNFNFLMRVKSKIKEEEQRPKRRRILRPYCMSKKCDPRQYGGRGIYKPNMKTTDAFCPDCGCAVVWRAE